MRCPSCDHDNRAERRFCTECGATLSLACPSCGAPAEAGEKFCGGCGAALVGSGQSAVGSPPMLQVSGAGFQVLGSDPRHPTPSTGPGTQHPAPETQGERRQLTVLFCDLVGSTPLSQQLDAEEWRDLIAQYQQAAAGAVARFGGHVAKNLGDGLLIYFGWPSAREDDPERAVRAGLAIIEQVSGLGSQVLGPNTQHPRPSTQQVSGVGSQVSGPRTQHPAPNTRLSVRVGMHTGPVVIADGGEVFGETANVAARDRPRQRHGRSDVRRDATRGTGTLGAAGADRETHRLPLGGARSGEPTHDPALGDGDGRPQPRLHRSRVRGVVALRRLLRRR